MFHSSELLREHLPTVPQGLLKVIVKNELIGATWESESAVSTFLPFNFDVVQRVITRLVPYRSGASPRTSGGKSGAWPREGAENEYYTPFALLPNKALEAAKKELGCTSGSSYHEKLQFSVYDCQVEDSVGQVHPLERMLVGCDRMVYTGEKLHWRAIMVPITVQRNWQKLVEQALKYARRLFATSAREFALVIGLNCETTEARFLFFHRSGLTSSPPAQLNTERGWMHFIEGIVGLASVKDRSGAGLETSRDTLSYHLPWFGLCKIDEIYCSRTCTRGQATYVSRVKPVRYEVRGNNNTLVCNNSLPELAGTPICSSLIVKDSWPKRSHNNEATMLKAVGGLFGLPAMYGSYIVKRPDGKDETTADFIPEDATPWDPWDERKRKEDPKPELRVHMRLTFESEGRPLSHASSPRELLEGILHGMVGYLNMFQMGWMHQEVSVGNVMLLKTPTKRPAFVPDPKYATEDFELIARWTDCIAMLTDGDHASLWCDRGKARVRRPSGTLPFLSIRLTHDWLFDKPFVHSPIDDLESFTWILMWASLEIIDMRGELSSTEKSYADGLRSYDLSRQVNIKKLIRSDLLMPENVEDEDTPSPMGNAFGPVLAEWLRLRQNAQSEALPLLEDSNADDRLAELTYKYFGKFVAVGFAQLDKLPGSWGEIFGS